MSLKNFLFQYDFLKKIGFLKINDHKYNINLTTNKTEELTRASSFGFSSIYSSYRTSYTTSYRFSYRTSYTASYRSSYQTSYTAISNYKTTGGVYKEIAAGGYGLNLV